ncbi:MAG: PmoA family protein [Planctomycetia bacterium]|nr:PmoA family protein [Planctomycetia bacterium]
MALPRCQVVPLPDHQAAFQIDGAERARWHFGPQYPRPFFYPLLGPSRVPLTRLGHPGAPDHDHHRSIWFAHHKVLGIDFWSDRTTARIEQKQWLAYEDGEAEAALAAALEWRDGHDPRSLVEQELVAAVRPGESLPPGTKGETFLELQATFRPTPESLEFGQTNFGFLAVRVAKAISAHFGGGQLRNSEGQRGEKDIFGRPARWMDYSGELAPGVTEGIAYFDHPQNPGYPSSWHVRDDGWMAASPCLRGPLEISQAKPLVLRYLLFAHGGAVDASRAEKISKAFAGSPGYVVAKSTAPHRQFRIARAGA